MEKIIVIVKEPSGNVKLIGAIENRAEANQMLRKAWDLVDVFHEPQPPEKPTVEELDAILNGPELTDVHVQDDGSVTPTVPQVAS